MVLASGSDSVMEDLNITRPALTPRASSATETTRWSSINDASVGSPSATFTIPHRSIFSSGLPTASLSVNTVHASMSSPQAGSPLHPLTTLSNTSPSSARRRIQDKPRALTGRRTRSSRVTKHADDPAAILDEGSAVRRPSGRPTSLAVTNLFAATDLIASRTTSYVQPISSPAVLSRTSSSTFAGILSHLYTRGLIEGRHSDITVHCFGQAYALHRLLLDRAPFFFSALSGPWYESTAKDITLHPEETDTNITQSAFELALKRIYGCPDTIEEAKHAINLFATGCWLEMTDLIEVSITLILKQMEPGNLSECIQFVTNNYYGKYGERVENAARAMLCREGYEMLLKYWVGIPGDIIKDTISNDAFYVPGEWERWVLARKLYDRRVRAKAVELDLVTTVFVPKTSRPKMSPILLRDHVVYEPEIGPDAESWIQVYADADIIPWYELFDRGIHYAHMTFEQLQQVRNQLDVFRNIQIVPESVVSAALWQSMLLRQKVINANETDVELGFAEYVSEEEASPLKSSDSDDSDVSADKVKKGTEKGKRPVAFEGLAEKEENEEEIGLEEEEVLQTLKYWIPVTDSTYSIGRDSDNPDTTLKNKTFQARASDGETTEATSWSNDTTISSPPVLGNSPNPPLLYSQFPPFRFAAEFPPAKSLKENKRVYSNTVWYAGSLWNVYIQKKETSKNTQLGIYLHREKHVEGAEDLLRNIAHNTNIDERVNSNEEKLYLRQPNRRSALLGNFGEGSDPYSDLLRIRPPPDLDTISGLVRPRGNTAKAGRLVSPNRPLNTAGAFSEEEKDDATIAGRMKKPALPPYVDSRSTIKTYFKIYAPSRCGRMLSVYESAPDQFNFSQSWGWKSSNLVIDNSPREQTEDETMVKEPRLRFTIVIGNV